MKSERPKHVFTDVDGTRYFQDSRGDIVNKFGDLVSLTEQDNIRAILSVRCRHNTTRTAQTSIVNPTRMRRMEWCDTCNELLDDREWNIPLPE